MLRITECRANHLVNPVGYKMDNPIFFWIMDGETAKKSRVVVSTEQGISHDTVVALYVLPFLVIGVFQIGAHTCLLYTSDAADD